MVIVTVTNHIGVWGKTLEKQNRKKNKKKNEKATE